MGLFQKKITSTNQPLYSTGLETILLIVGLGNIGKEYKDTRHNIGFAVLDKFAKNLEFEDWISKKDLHCQLTSKSLDNSTRVILCKPTTYMNESGRAVKAVQQFYKIPNSKTLVVHDELDISFGQLRTKLGGGTAGHNGLKSIVQHCGEDFCRVRIGIGPKEPQQMDSSDFVLARFNKEQQEQLPALLKETSSILSEYCYGKGELPTEIRNFIL